MSRKLELQNLILKAKQAYYYGGNPIMTDREYDALEDELRGLDPGDPALALVGAPVPADSMLTKATHRIPMGSQSKVNSAEEFRAWYQKSCDGKSVHVSLKGDGASAAAYYEQGRLTQVISRGDGTVGEDITANAIKFKGLPVRVPDEFTGAIRMEVILTVEDWGVVDPARSKNPRNAGAGIMGRKNGAQSELLTCHAFDIDENVGAETFSFRSETEKIGRIQELGCRTIEAETCKNADEVISYFERVTKDRADLPIWIDGVVIKVDDIALQRSLGVTAGKPKGQIAWKFDSEGAESVLLSVSVSGGHTGALIPNAQLAPVEIGGTTVSNASLANWDEVARLGLAEGDRVWVIKANDIIPKVIRVTQRGPERKEIPVPSSCPFCGGSVGRRVNTGGEEGVVLECQNDECPQKSVGKIKRWITSVEIDGIGDSVRSALVEQMGLEDASGLYRLLDDPEALASLVINQDKDLRLGEKRAATILRSIESKRSLPLTQFLGSLGIDRLGQRRVQLMVNAAGGQLNTLADWRDGKLRDPDFAETAGAPNTGPAIQDGIEAMSNLIDCLLEAGVDVLPTTPSEESTSKGALPSVCISGRLESGKKKKDYAGPLAEAGYTLVDKVDSGLDYLVLADPSSTSSKAKRARKLSVQVISEQQLISLIEQ